QTPSSTGVSILAVGAPGLVGRCSEREAHEPARREAPTRCRRLEDVVAVRGELPSELLMAPTRYGSQLNSQLRTVSPRRQMSPPLPPLIESVPLPPLRRSSPARPSIWSFPPKPWISFGAPFPISVSEPSPPSMCSMLASVSLPWPVACPVLRST